MKAWPSLALACALLGCGDDSEATDVHGSYALNVTYGPSTCPLSNWMQGTTASGIPFTVAQKDRSVSADVGGVGALFLDAYCGKSHLDGVVSGADLDLTLHGTRSLSSGSCAYTIDAHLVTTINGDALSGSITYTPNTNTSADCAAVRVCNARMNLNGTRPPSGQ